jgi:hypothetical protein
MPYCDTVNLTFEDGLPAPSYQLMFQTSNKITHNESTMQTIDMLLGIIGGFSALVWQVFGLCFSGYDAYHLEEELLNKFYSTENNVKSKGIREANTGLIYEVINEGDNSVGAKVAQKLYSRKAYNFSYWHAMYAKLLRCCCCCFKTKDCMSTRLERLRLHEENIERMNNEIDIVG